LLWMSNIIDNKKVTDQDDDLKHVVLCQKGNVGAFEVLVERHQKKMLNIAFRMMGDYDEACDVTQEAFLAAYKAINKFKAEAKFSTWLYRIVVNYSKNRLKQMGGRDRREAALLDDSGEIKTEGVSNPVDCENPGTRLEIREREAQVQKCIMSLDEEYRDVLILRDIQGFSYEEISGILKIPDGTVKSRLSRARNALKDCLIRVMGDL
jgi:RNA polymerase sigma-70 factor, ECF subfamily